MSCFSDRWQSGLASQETLNYWKQLPHILKYFRENEDSVATLPRNFMQGFLEVMSPIKPLIFNVHRPWLSCAKVTTAGSKLIFCLRGWFLCQHVLVHVILTNEHGLKICLLKILYGLTNLWGAPDLKGRIFRVRWTPESSKINARHVSRYWLYRCEGPWSI